ncbi:phage holin, lambda family, partial [Escherichia coli]|nr:phage holin, lambda family [Escherichia coli]
MNWWGNNSGGHVAWPFYFQHSTRKYREVRDDEM